MSHAKRRSGRRRSRRARCRAAVLAALVVAAVAPAAGARDDEEQDQVYLAKGKPLSGRVVYEDDMQVVLRVGSRFREIDREDVKSVDAVTHHLHALLDRHAGLRSDDVEGLLELARFASSHRLPGEARLLYLRAVLLDPAERSAHLALGNKERKGAWLVRHGRKWHAAGKLDGLGEEWDQRWSLATTHFELQGNIELKRAIQTALDLERIYRAFFDLFGQELHLYDVVEDPMHVRVHGDDASYPEPSNGGPGYFDSSSRTLYVNAARGLSRTVLVHEATHQLLYMTTQRTKGARGHIPGWLDEGLADYLGRAARGRPGRATFQLGPEDLSFFQAHAQAPKPLGLSRMLTLEASDFQASSNAYLKYAQSYTLVHYLMHGQQGGLRAPFHDFLRRAYDGRSSMSDFKKTLGKDLDAFEEGWLAYVRASNGGQR